MKSIHKERDIWRNNIAKLIDYHNKHGDYFVPLKWKNDKPFSLWVENIRKYPKRLPEKDLKELKKIGFTFDMPKDWNRMFERLEQFFKTHGHTIVPSQNKEFDELSDWTVNQRKAKHLLTSAQIKELDSLQFEWETLNDNDLRWEYRYRELLDFKKEYGHTQVPDGYKENRPLARWVGKQRKANKQRTLSMSKVTRLSEIGFLFNVLDQRWAKRYTELAGYKKENGHLNRLQIKRDNYTLGLWVETQIVMRDKMSPERKRKLNVLGLKLEKEDVNAERWNNKYEKLKSFYAQFGHCRVPVSYDYPLTVWLRRNRAFKKSLSPEKIKKLEHLGFKWNHETFRELWQRRYQSLKEFKKKNGHANVLRSDDEELYEWTQFQKRMKLENRLDRQREEMLSKLGMTWRGQLGKQKMEVWESMFQKFKTLKEKYKDNYHIKLKELPELKYWVGRQAHNKTKLSAYKKKRLNSIDFPWDRTGKYNYELWDRKFEALLKFKKKYGHADVPGDFSNKSLAKWVALQRTRKISDDKKDKLNKIGFSWAHEIKERRWRQRLDEFLEMKKKNTLIHLRAHHPLHSWIYQQRKNFDTLPGYRKKELTRAGVVVRQGVK